MTVRPVVLWPTFAHPGSSAGALVFSVPSPVATMTAWQGTQAHSAIATTNDRVVERCAIELAGGASRVPGGARIGACGTTPRVRIRNAVDVARRRHDPVRGVERAFR